MRVSGEMKEKERFEDGGDRDRSMHPLSLCSHTESHITYSLSNLSVELSFHISLLNYEGFCFTTS